MDREERKTFHRNSPCTLCYQAETCQFCIMADLAK